ncbi:hypothetical protein VOLCADRAFT_65732 [Volvox carteri f. nagariensis]|uniref:lipoyl(octanoyl) transferase n=1 Tax=Volvox carteri f. nagariensis TaxID=3068 RepID=D8U9G4_VOLCA|nr:uncharacterized protein VOLCADRAFT_65732 [Volvox carteri f. nagariensis]EFJ43580.1 hypothetical protein VOLCADRAFT_65732 [Volvox carteri f. nagariensis]|eukprot:XP_002955280.1 hypothetical protein VOLCADRAFT_65732 [Volvox carteri f. nagariensis]
MLQPLRVINLASSLTPYLTGIKLQDSVAEERRQGLVGDTLILLQHYPVYTLGKRGKESDFRTSRKEIEATGAEICSVPRGGEVTFHGPGQLVAYPIVGVRQAGLGARAYVEGLEDSIIDCLAKYGITARGRVPGATGVWVAERKIAAIGVRISQGVSSHGLALNVDTDLSYFHHIVPCGIADKEVTSIRKELESVGRDGTARMQQWTNACPDGVRGGDLGGRRGPSLDLMQVADDFTKAFRSRLGFPPG